MEIKRTSHNVSLTHLTIILCLVSIIFSPHVQAQVYEVAEDPNLKELSAQEETTIQPEMVMPSTGGPDEAGYYYIDSLEPGGPAFDWEEISGTGTNLNLTDDSYYFPIVLPFSFNFYGTGYSQVTVGSNGGIYFESRSFSFTNGCIPRNFSIDRLIAVYWDDLCPDSSGNVYYKIVGTEPERKLVVQWQGVRHFGSTRRITAQAQLFENGDILLLYADPSSEAGQRGTVGIQGDPSVGLQYLCNEVGLSQGLAILFRRDFTCNEPELPYEPQPEDGAMDVPINTLLEWNGYSDDPENDLTQAPTTTVLDAADRGWWDDSGYHSASNKNTFTGQNGSGTELYNSFFVFDLTSVSSSSFSSAILRLEIENYYGPDASESVTIYDVSTPISVLTATGRNTAVYNDLHSGNSYGDFTVFSTDEGSILEINLNSQALADIGAATGGYFAVGLHVNDIGMASGGEGVRFSQTSETRVHQLVLTSGSGGGTGEASAYDLYLGTDASDMDLIGSDLEEPMFNPCILDYETTYFWKVVAKNDCGQTEGPVWSFTTQSWQQLPEDGAMDTPITAIFEWSSLSDEGGGGDCEETCGIENGGFETGEFDPWVAVTGPGNELTPWNIGIGDRGAWGNGYPFEGVLCAQNGFDGSAGLFYNLYQETEIPECAPSAILTWSERIQWSMGGTLPREYIVSVQPAGGGTPLAIVYSFQLNPNTQGDTGYVTHSVDLLELEPSIAGQTVRINFHEYIPESYTGPAQFDLDGISLVCGGELQRTNPVPVQTEIDTESLEALMTEYNAIRENALANPTVLGTVYETTEDSNLKEEDAAQTTETSAQIIMPGIGGPDAGGYYYFDNLEPDGPEFDWIEISGNGTNLNLSDDSFYYPISLPFGFDFYGASYNMIAVGSNGGIYFEDRYLTLNNRCIPGDFTIDRFIALYWDDLTPDSNGRVYYKIVGSAPERRLIVQWQNVRHFGTSDPVTAQVQLFENGDILMLYADPSNEAGSGGTVGIQDDPSVGLQYLCNERGLSAGLAVLFTRNPGGDDEQAPVVYDVYLGTDISDMELVGSDLEEPTFEPCILDYETTYFWQVVARNDCGLTTSPIWSFTTEPWLPQPEDGAMDVLINAILEWNGPIGGGEGDCNGTCGVENGGFETGEFAPWIPVTGPGQEILPWQIWDTNNGLPLEGNYHAICGFEGTAGLFYDLYQEVAIPRCATTAMFSWSEYLYWEIGAGTLPREYIVSIQLAGGGSPMAILYSRQLQPNTSGNTGYVPHSVDLLELVPSIAGQTIRINFHAYVPENWTGVGLFLLDGISLTCGDEVLINSQNTSEESILDTAAIEELLANYEQTRQQALDTAQQIRDEHPWPSVTETSAVLPEPSRISADAAPSLGEILNGDFETGSFNGWTLLNVLTNPDIEDYFGSFVINDGSLLPYGPDEGNPLQPYNGSYSALNNIEGPGIFTIYQDVTLPTGTATLTLQWVDMIRNHYDEGFEDPSQEFRVEVWNLNNVSQATLFSTDPGDPAMADWTERSADLSAFAGQTVRIAFTVDVQLFFFNVHLDNIRIDTSSTPPPPITSYSYDVYLGTDISQMQLVGIDLAEPNLSPCILDYETTYFWQVVASNDCGQIISPIWAFTTEPWSPQPEDGAMDVPINTILEWNGPSGEGNCEETCGIENGGFETGEFDPWVAVTGPGNELTPWNIGIGDRGAWGNGYPFEGVLCAQNGFDGSAGLFYNLYQETEIPECAPSAILTWSERIQWSMGGTLPREYIVSVQPAGGGTPLAIVYSFQLNPNTQGDTGYVTHSVDLLELEPSIAGQTVRINFHEYIPESYTGPAQFDLDGISLVCGGEPVVTEPQTVSPLSLSSDGLEAVMAEYNNIREAQTSDQTEPTSEDTDPTEGGSYCGIPSRNLAYALSSTDTQQVIDAFDRGWWLSDGSHDASNKNTYTGCSNSQILNSFFAFDLSSVQQDVITNAILRLEIENYFGSDASESLTIFDVSTPISILTSSENNINVFYDLESGNSYGNFTVVPTDVGSVLEITLNRQAITDINNAMGGYFAVGLHLDNITTLTGREAVRFSVSDEPRVHQLVLTTYREGGTDFPVTYDVYLGTDASQMEMAGSDLEEPTFNPCILDYETTYFWQVVAKNDCSQTVSPVWSFTTQPWQPMPEDGAMDVPIDTMLGWNGPAGGDNSVEIRQQVLDMVSVPPEGMMFRQGMLVESLDEDDTNTPVSTDTTMQPQLIPGATLITFDDYEAPCLFMNTVRLTNEYEALGVIFEGPGGNDGAANVNECGGWGVSGHTSPNFLGFNINASLSDGGTPMGPEVIHFNPPVSHVEFIAGVGSSDGTVFLEAYNDNGDMIDDSSITISATMTPISVSGTGITRAVISTSATAFVLDDLQFIPESPRPPQSNPVTYDVYLGTDASQMEMVGSDLEEATFNPCILDYETTYFWQVVAKNDCGQTVSPIWSFTTLPWQPMPEDGAIEIPIETMLGWNRPSGNTLENVLIDSGTVYEATEDSNLKEEDAAQTTETSAQIIMPGIGGPDAGGYYYFDNLEPDGPEFDWIEISGNGTNLNLSDDSFYYPISLPFGFDFYGASYNMIAVGSNGGIYFEDRYLTLNNRCIPGDFTIDRFIALYWDDLTPDSNGRVYYKIVGSAPERRLIVQWQNVRHFGTSDPVTAQVQLFENGDILMLYADPSNEAGSGGTVGIQDDPSVGLQYLCNERGLSAGLAVLFTRNPGGDDEQAPITYDVYFGMNPNDPAAWELIASDLNAPECDPTPEPDEVLRKGRIYYWQVVAKQESCGEVISPVWSFRTVNTPPVADAGDDQTVFCWIDGFVDVTLDGSGSYDEDENPITYLWSWTIDNQTYTATGVSPTITLPAGVHTITLVVNDTMDDSLPDEVVITAEAPVEVTVNCTPKSLNCESNGNWITAHFTLPEGYSITDINSSAVCTLEPLGLESSQLQMSNNDQGQGVLAMTFNRTDFCEMQPPLGYIQLIPTGRLNSGHYFYAVDEIRVLDNRMEHMINLGLNWLNADCAQPKWCDGLDINTDGVVDLKDFVLIK